MKNTFKTELRGMLDSKSSYIQLDLDEVYIGKKRYLNLTSTVKVQPHREMNSTNTLESFSIKTYVDNKLIDKKVKEINIADGYEETFENEIEIDNTQTENRFFKLELDDVRGEKIEYACINELVFISPVIDSKVYIKLNYLRRGNKHYFAYETNSDSKVYLKLNNRNWLPLTEDFFINDDDLEGKVNYAQLYTTDEENTKVYSNVVRFIKNETSE